MALLSALFAGSTAILAKCGIRNIDSTVATAIRTCVVLVFAWGIVFSTGAIGGLTDIGLRSLLFLVLSGLSTGASWLCYFKALQLGDVNKVVAIDKSSVVLTIVLAFVLLHEKVGVLQLIALAAIGAGTLLMLQKKPEENRRTKRGWMFFAICSAGFASLTSILGKIGIESVDSNLGTAIRTVVVLLMAWAVVFVTGKKQQCKSLGVKNWIFLVLSGVTTGASWLCYYRALQKGPASVIVPIDKLSIVVSVAFSYVFLRERLTKKAWLGLGLIVAGTLMMLL